MIQIKLAGSTDRVLVSGVLVPQCLLMRAIDHIDDPAFTIAPEKRAFSQIPCTLSLFAFFLAPEQFFHVTALAIFQVSSFFALDLLVGNMRGCGLVVSLQSPPHIVSSSWRIHIALYVIAVVAVGTAPKYLKQLTTITYSFHSASQVH
jgi:hypothetical protein